MRILVTGAAGFIGSNLVDRLLADGHTVVGVDDLSRGKMANLASATDGKSFSFVQQDITDPAFAKTVAEVAPEAICHLAAQIDVRISVTDPLLDARLNVLGTINVLEAARLGGVRKIVFTSSGGSIYGEPDQFPVNEGFPVDPYSQYAASKAAGEIYLGVYRHLYGLQTTALALSNVYGPRQDPHGEAGVVAIFCSAALKAGRAKIFGDGSSIRDYVYVGDVVDAFAKSVYEVGDGERYNIGTAVGTSVLELHKAVADIAGTPDDPEFADARLGELRAITLDSAKAVAQLGWRPRTDLAEGVAATYEWMKRELALV
jgi:UDP-glucose 4-epimerase